MRKGFPRMNTALDHLDAIMTKRLEQYSIPEPMSGCTLWFHACDRHGYGRLNVGNGWAGAHRVAWTMKHGKIPDGAWVLHKCDNPPCINVDHLFLGDALTNQRDRIRKGRGKNMTDINREKTHCPSGHEYTLQNTRLGRNGARFCRTCARGKDRIRYANNRAVILDRQRTRRCAMAAIRK
jgi:hypothetical protein